MQIILFKENVAIALANTEYRDTLFRGDTLNKPYRSHPQAVDYTKGSDITAKDRYGTNEQLTVDTIRVVPFYVDDIDRIQNKWDLASQYAQDSQRLLNNELDQAIASQVANADNYIDAGDVGGSAGSDISLSTSNINLSFLAANRKLDTEDAPQAGRFALIGPRTLQVVRDYIAGKDTSMADIVGANGKVGERFGFEIYYSNNCYFTATLAMATNPSDGNTVTINGCVLEFKSTIANATAGYIGVLLDGSLVDTSRAALVAAINDSGTAGTTYTAQATGIDEARWKLSKAGVVATNSNSLDTMTIVAYGDIVVSETLTASADVWSSQRNSIMFGVKKATDLVLQKSPNVEFRIAEKRLGRFVYPWMLYGIKNFDDADKLLVQGRIDASGWS